MSSISRTMLLAAGRGARMKPLSDTLPKPLISICGRTILDRMLDRFCEQELVVINVWHLPDLIEEAVAERCAPPITVLREARLLDTGGGVLNALPLLDSDAFFVANTDVVLWEPRQPALDVLCRAWEPETMDALLLLVPMQNAGGFEGAGDFFLGRDGKIERPSPGEAAPFVYASIQIVASHLFDDPPEVPFSFNLLWDRAAARARLAGVVLDGGWFTIDRPEKIREAEAWLSTRN